MERQNGTVEFDFTPEQKEKFNAIYEETKKLYPHLVGDDISKQKIKVLIAHTVIHGDIKLEKKEENVFDEIQE